MYLNEAYGRVPIGKHLSGMVPIKNGLKKGDASSPLLFNFAVEYAIKTVQVNQDGLNLIVTHQFPVDADDVNILVRWLITTEKNTEALVVASKETGLEVNAGKTEYMVMSRNQDAGRSHNMTTDNRSFEKVEEFKYFGTTLNSKNSIQEEIKSRLKSGNACYTVRQLYNETYFILTKIVVLSMKKCMPAMRPTFICNLATPQRPTLSMTRNMAPFSVGSDRTWSQ